MRVQSGPADALSQDRRVHAPLPEPPLKAHSLMSGAAPILDDTLAPRPWIMLARHGE